MYFLNGIKSDVDNSRHQHYIKNMSKKLSGVSESIIGRIKR